MLADLNLANNVLSELPDTFADMRALVKLTLSGNQLTTLPPSIGRMPSLKVTETNTIFSTCYSLLLLLLQVLDASGNKLVSLPRFDVAPNLTTLLLGQNSLVELPPLTGCRKLADVDVSQNKLTDWPELPETGTIVKVWRID